MPTIDGSRSPLLATDRGLLRDFIDSAKRFNRAWNQFVDEAGLDDVNRLRSEYNRFYPMEKSCAFGTDSVNDEFVSLPVLGRSFLEERFPLLHILTLA